MLVRGVLLSDFLTSLSSVITEPYIWIACLVSAVVCGLLVVFKDFYMKGPAHAHIVAVQSAHRIPTPRYGGVGILCGMLVGVFLIEEASRALYGLFMLSTVPVFAAGLAEDMGFGVRPRHRLLAAAVSSICAMVLLNTWVMRLGIPFLEPMIAFAPCAILFTVLASSGICNAFNLIDGLNGLSAGAGVIAALGLATVAAQAGLPDMMQMSFFMAAVLCGFLLFNYPFGKIFMGDAGAYSLGHMLSWFAIYMVSQAPQMSPWATVLILFWPVADTFFAIYRRRRSGKATDQPDRLHYHQLVMRALEIFWLGRDKRHIANPLATLFLLPFIIGPVIAGVILWDNNMMAFTMVAVFSTLFVASYLLGMRLAARRAFQIGASARISTVRKEMVAKQGGGDKPKIRRVA